MRSVGQVTVGNGLVQDLGNGDMCFLQKNFGLIGDRLGVVDQPSRRSPAVCTVIHYSGSFGLLFAS